MQWTVILAMANAAMAFLEKAIPQLRNAFKKGDISVEEQKAFEARVDKLGTDEAFTGPEWDKSGR